ncbi:MAG: Sec-independent protein translocase subunit TatB [Burkholderiales bacterium]|nr:Sec-independent protein translocase subunit TatB [Burkholderiales bacterium]
MFDFGFSEMMVIGVVALLVIGPEKLPRVARTIGALMGRAQRYVADVKADINREIELDELKKLKTSVTEAAATIESSVRETVSGLEAQASEINNLANGVLATDGGVQPATTAGTEVVGPAALAEAAVAEAAGPAVAPASSPAQGSLALDDPAQPVLKA